ncbi:MAG: hypothetical protein ACXVZ1_01690 [Gaiellaceae bacterium]
MRTTMQSTTEMPCGGVSRVDRLASPAIWPAADELQKLSDELGFARSELLEAQRQTYEMVGGVREAFAAQDAVIRVLARARTLEAAAEPLLEALCASLEFDLAMLWAPDPMEGALRVIARWQQEEASTSFLAIAESQSLPTGAGVAGRVFSQVAPLLADDAELLARGPIAVAMAVEGLRTACAFPVAGPSETLAVVELVRRAPLGSEHSLEPAVRAIGDRIAAFIEREQLEERYLALFTLLESRIDEQDRAAAARQPVMDDVAGAKVIPLRRIERAA